MRVDSTTYCRCYAPPAVRRLYWWSGGDVRDSCWKVLEDQPVNRKLHFVFEVDAPATHDAGRSIAGGTLEVIMACRTERRPTTRETWRGRFQQQQSIYLNMHCSRLFRPT